MRKNNKNSNLKDITILYFDKIDNGHFDQAYLNMFTEDILLEFPKFGSKTGIESLSEFGQKISSRYKNLKHHIDPKDVQVINNLVFVEGILSGETTSGMIWPDNISSYGKFCSVFEFVEEKIKRISIYSDPDFASQDQERLNFLK
ncbi:nuclear transport factor 2 family protein [Flavobacterium hiemivividum]|uniref:Nuclear transport factor 2 family protein n=1 Tax=Flavobacterium hiemivividum TaxID=2541734 RepID=A0A4R5CSB3_9FLAO|nr:nuclear transport factor 2 family protein [Flavobacterium hiemivividum]TDE03469.1 nuclear transport factor 2 family protein [Flavobacterium hiemivividum]